jgi:hypothetical protein
MKLELGLYSDELRVGRSGFDSRQGQDIFLFSTISRRALELTQTPIQWVPGIFSRRYIRWPGREADHSPSSAEVELYLQFPCVFMAWYLINEAHGQLRHKL